MKTTTRVGSGTDRYLEEFERRERRDAARTPSWLATLRRSAMTRFAERGFPTTRDEDWRYTNLGQLPATPFRMAGELGPRDLSGVALDRLAIGPGVSARLVFVDGRYAPELSSRQRLPGGARLSSLAEAMTADGELVERHLTRHAGWDVNVFAALSTAFLQDGAFLHVPAETVIPEPIELIMMTSVPGVLSQPRILIIAGPHSRFTVVERHLGLTDACFANAVTEIAAGPGASVDHVVLQEQGASAYHMATIHADLQRDSVLSTCEATFGARLARTTLTVRFVGEGGRGSLAGLYVMGGRQHVDHHVTVDHAVPRCSSQQLYKGVLGGSARAVFNGRVIVRPDAQKTDATQTNKHLLLSDGVEVDSKPQLEIFADDVKCTHGAAEGQLAPEAIFYMRNRGLDETAARQLLTIGFVREVVDRIAVEPIRRYLDRLLETRLGQGLLATGSGNGKTS
jgi:Fe-S cluster assembly protein SufD